MRNIEMNDPRSIDQLFISRLSEIVLRNMQNENFGVEEFAHQAGISRSSIHRRLRALNYENISHFIRAIRLRRAMELLRNHEGAVSEIAYRVGFGSPAYFNKCFHDYYGYPPGEVKIRFIEENIEGPEFSGMEGISGISQHPPSHEEPVGHDRLLYFKLLLSLAIVVAILSVTWVVYHYLARLDGSSGNLPVTGRDVSLVVVPLRSYSDDPQNQHFADGVMEDILNQLALIPGLRVISRTTSDKLRDNPGTARQIARELNASYLLEGSVQKQGNTVRVNVQLIDGKYDQHIWAQVFEKELGDIFTIQGEIARNIADSLKVVLTAGRITENEKAP
ncbi:MAG: helix-turn-helix domain-containing protein [Bacteroidales bacterium]|nr:helix-turn-helix domain-containing protein [Bacteroidales bacterium]